MRLIVSHHESPIGPLALASDEQGRLRGVSFAGEREGAGREALLKSMRREYPEAEPAEGETPDALIAGLDAYFNGDPDALTRIEWSLDGARTEGFQQRVWRALAEVPAGQTITYGEMARRAGEPGGAQAAGVALNRNPIGLVLPCHRVIGADGAMIGFGGGLERKTWLLRHEGALLL